MACRGVLLLGALALLVPASVQAQHVVVWPGAHASPAALEDAMRATRLRGPGVRIKRFDEAERQLGSGPLATCAAVECAHEMVRALEVDAVVLVSVTESGGQPSAVLVQIVGAASGQVAASRQVPVLQGNLTTAIENATGEAWEQFDATQTVSVELTSTPPGAQVSEGSRQLGQTPLQTRLSVGEHELLFNLENFAPVTRTLTLTSASDEPIHVDFESGGATSGAFDAMPHILGGSGLLVAGAVLIVLGPLVAQTCTTPSMMGTGCLDGAGFDEPLMAAMVAGGVGLLAAGAVWLTWALLQPSASTTVALGPGSLVVRGTFE